MHTFLFLLLLVLHTFVSGKLYISQLSTGEIHVRDAGNFICLAGERVKQCPGGRFPLNARELTDFDNCINPTAATRVGISFSNQKTLTHCVSTHSRTMSVIELHILVGRPAKLTLYKSKNVQNYFAQIIQTPVTTTYHCQFFLAHP